MKRKLNIILALTMVSLTGIIMFQVYWSVNAYKVNKKKFDSDIDLAMQRAMDSCKKDYFDSIRTVLVHRFKEVTIKVDTVHERDTINVMLSISMSTDGINFSQPFNVTTPVLEFYRKKIGHKATLPEVLVDMSFYVPSLMNQFTVLFGMKDIEAYPKQLSEYTAFEKKNIIVPPDSLMKFHHGMDSTIYGFPKNTRQADSLRLRRHFRYELGKLHARLPFSLYFSDKSSPPRKPTATYSETAEYSYKYHGFKVFNIVGPEYFARASFRSPYHAVMRDLMLILSLSLLLIVFCIYCFNYIIKTIITQRKLAELKDDFINNMTHELKTPIATMTVAIEGLQKFNALSDPEKTQRYLQTSRNELNRLNDIVSKVLNVAAFESGEIRLVKESVNINELVNDVISTEQFKTGKKVGINYENKDNIQSVNADKLHLRSVLVNLVDNAIKYSDEPVNISITCYKEGNNAVLSVKDNGRGIPPAHTKQVFDKFHRVPSGNIHNVKGTGLGLSYVKYIVEAHGGNVGLKSELNAGSEFIVSIPL